MRYRCGSTAPGAREGGSGRISSDDRVGERPSLREDDE